ncbi:hypothetical protein [Methanoculleus sp. MH98A]|uniref:hypothetical protein n=1 Tax=Methanoculleus sp. MH98A TaxID=1495314 RepID=UPI00049F300B|nr:hypothetical protein [Methanoculleus sp. MH98A]KDE55345.1 hypothetical protein EI28_07695 [Methanoculleus sp. MH98A]
MKRIFILSLALLLLAFGAGCIGSPEMNATENVTPAPVLHYERGDVSIPINTSEIPVRGFDANVTEVIEILLADQRAGALLEGGWKIASVRTGFDYDLRTHVDVEFRSDEPSPSFFIEVDEQEGQTGWGRCNVPRWLGGPFAGPYPEDYHQNRTFYHTYVFDHHNDRVTMVYNDTTIFYLYPSYGREWYERVEVSG